MRGLRYLNSFNFPISLFFGGIDMSTRNIPLNSTKRETLGYLRVNRVGRKNVCLNQTDTMLKSGKADWSLLCQQKKMITGLGQSFSRKTGLLHGCDSMVTCGRHLRVFI